MNACAVHLLDGDLVYLFFKETATTEIYTDGHTLALHGARPIAQARRCPACRPSRAAKRTMSRAAVRRNPNHGMLMLGDGQEGAVTASASADSVRPPRHRGASPSRAARPRNRKHIHQIGRAHV